MVGFLDCFLGRGDGWQSHFCACFNTYHFGCLWRLALLTLFMTLLSSVLFFSQILGSLIFFSFTSFQAFRSQSHHELFKRAGFYFGTSGAPPVLRSDQGFARSLGDERRT